MTLPARCVVWLLPLVLLTGCFNIFHKTRQMQAPQLAPPIEDTPPPPPVPSPTDLPPSVVTVPNLPPVADTSAPPIVILKPPVKRKKPAPAPPPAANSQQASNGNPGVSAIGQLSSGDPPDQRQQAVNSIAAIERAANAISRGLNDQEKKTVSQIREFLKQARAALASGDVDGAGTLAAKAKVLLGELSQ